MKKIFILMFIAILFIANCAKPSEPAIGENTLEIEKFIETGRYAIDIDVSDDYIYIVEDEIAFSIYSIDGNEQLCYVSNFTGGVPYENLKKIAVCQENDDLFIYHSAGGGNTIDIYDVSDPQAPNWVFNIGGNTSSVDDMNAYYGSDNVTDFYWTNNESITYGYYDPASIYQWNSVNTFNYNNPLNYNSNEYFKGFDVADGISVSANDQAGIKILKNELDSLKSSLDLTGEAIDVKIKGDYAIVALRQEGIAIVDISDIENPELKTTKDVGELIYTISIEDDLLLLGSHSGGVILYDISDITSPFLLDKMDSDEIGYTFKAILRNGKAYAATRKGVYIIGIN